MSRRKSADAALLRQSNMICNSVDIQVQMNKDCFYYYSSRHNVVVLFGTLKVQYIYIVTMIWFIEAWDWPKNVCTSEFLYVAVRVCVTLTGNGRSQINTKQERNKTDIHESKRKDSIT